MDYLVDHPNLRLKDPPKDSPLGTLRPADTPVRFIPTAEISSIYKRDGRVRKNHNLVFVPTLYVTWEALRSSPRRPANT